MRRSVLLCGAALAAIIAAAAHDFGKAALAMTFPFPAFSPYEAAASGITLISRDSTGVTGTVSGSTLNFASVPIGTASSTRFVVCFVRWSSFTTNRTLNSATIGGVSANIDFSFYTGNVSTGNFYIVSAVVPSGTTATVVLTFSGSTAANSICFATAVDGVSSTTPLSSTQTTIPSGTTSGSITMNLQNGGFAVMMCSANSLSGTDQFVYSAPFTRYVNTTSPSRLYAYGDAFPTATDAAASCGVSYAGGSGRAWNIMGVSYR